MILTLFNNSMLHSSGFSNFTINLIKSVECQCKFHANLVLHPYHKRHRLASIYGLNIALGKVYVGHLR